MGLDIGYFKNIELVGNATDYDDFEEKYGEEGDYLFVLPEWGEDLHSSRLGNLVPGGVYTYQEGDGFRAGSYSGYNYWRGQLSMLALEVTPNEVWDNREKYQEAPFYPLIDFSDCDGWLGTPVCTLLAKDFAEFQEKANQHSDKYFKEKYSEWREAFEVASQNGCVQFH